MSYSRWSNSRWYTFWCSTRGPEDRNTAKFEVMDSVAPLRETSRTFYAAEIRKNVDVCVGKFTGTTEELQELKGYMGDFLESVDRRYAE